MSAHEVYQFYCFEPQLYFLSPHFSLTPLFLHHEKSAWLARTAAGPVQEEQPLVSEVAGFLQIQEKIMFHTPFKW